MMLEPIAGVFQDRVANLEVEVRLISLEDGEELRRSVLRPGEKNWRFPFSPTSDFFHMGAFYANRLVSVVSFLIESSDNAFVGRGESWRLRGMATKPEMQNRGVGGQLLEQGFAEVNRRKGASVWCYARTSAARFYQDHGFQPYGEIFDIPGAGLHALHIKQLEPIALSDKVCPKSRSA
ncbi:GNAT family N-acetyltransferase [Bradyrhizobium sp. CB3481]|uniref:GNAT family N-acetyltransferase n=1 Tax=Bradyrhizobium sp. CB3481 TaxID=3039158 RepID=UPI0024B25DED|nr:GNAT family N-acetyltransferase [Bradyrhizobium sp. CB3481]WFU14862.1 GNAT family N-acetyltransferase [Bradyrhizobium sp. CB3481]